MGNDKGIGFKAKHVYIVMTLENMTHSNTNRETARVLWRWPGTCIGKK